MLFRHLRLFSLITPYYKADTDTLARVVEMVRHTEAQHRQSHRWTNRQTDRWTDTETDMQMDTRMDRHTDSQTDKQTDRNTEREREGERAKKKKEIDWQAHRHRGDEHKDKQAAEPDTRTQVDAHTHRQPRETLPQTGHRLLSVSVLFPSLQFFLLCISPSCHTHMIPPSSILSFCLRPSLFHSLSDSSVIDITLVSLEWSCTPAQYAFVF